MYKNFSLALIAGVTMAQQAPPEDPMAQYNCQTEKNYTEELTTYIMGGGVVSIMEWTHEWMVENKCDFSASMDEQSLESSNRAWKDAQCPGEFRTEFNRIYAESGPINA
jgi:hypothetical protein